MTVDVAILEGPLPAAGVWRPAGAGAVIVFDGVVRPREDGRPLFALSYEEYPPMTIREMTRLAREVGSRHSLVAIRVEHSRGTVPAGMCSFRLFVAAHRGGGIAAMDEFIDRMKKEVPLWKVPVWPD